MTGKTLIGWHVDSLTFPFHFFTYASDGILVRTSGHTRCLLNGLILHRPQCRAFLKDPRMFVYTYRHTVVSLSVVTHSVLSERSNCSHQDKGSKIS